jgi:hypothetical protein
MPRGNPERVRLEIKTVKQMDDQYEREKKTKREYMKRRRAKIKKAKAKTAKQS